MKVTFIFKFKIFIPGTGSRSHILPSQLYNLLGFYNFTADISNIFCRIKFKNFQDDVKFRKEYNLKLAPVFYCTYTVVHSYYSPYCMSLNAAFGILSLRIFGILVRDSVVRDSVPVLMYLFNVSSNKLICSME